MVVCSAGLVQLLVNVMKLISSAPEGIGVCDPCEPLGFRNIAPKGQPAILHADEQQLEQACC